MLNRLLCKLGIHEVESCGTDFLCIHCNYIVCNREGYYPTRFGVFLIYLFVGLFASPIFWFLVEWIKVAALWLG